MRNILKHSKFFSVFADSCCSRWSEDVQKGGCFSEKETAAWTN